MKKSIVGVLVIAVLLVFSITGSALAYDHSKTATLYATVGSTFVPMVYTAPQTTFSATISGYLNNEKPATWEFAINNGVDPWRVVASGKFTSSQLRSGSAYVSCVVKDSDLWSKLVGNTLLVVIWDRTHTHSFIVGSNYIW